MVVAAVVVMGSITHETIRIIMCMTMVEYMIATIINYVILTW